MELGFHKGREIARLRAKLDRVLSAGIERWHESATSMPAHEWLGLSEREYALWVELDWEALAAAPGPSATSGER